MIGRRSTTRVIGARCTVEGCDWGPLGTEDPDAWDVIERTRLAHERDTDHRTTVEVTRREHPAGGSDGDGAPPRDSPEAAVELVCPRCESGADPGDGARCPACGGPLREAFP